MAAAQDSPEITALEGQANEIDALLADLGPGEWDRPTRCPPMTVRELVGHLGGVLHRFVGSLFSEEAGEPVDTDRISYWKGTPSDNPHLVVEEGRRESSGRTDEDLVAWWREGAVAAVDAIRQTPPEHKVSKDGRVLNAVELAATRVVELGVHGMDIGHATFRGERICPEAAQVVSGILDGLLAEPLPRAIGWDRRTYILTGTGRRRLEPNERYALGPLADRFPLLR